ncbi:glycoside hydrolase family 1 protein [Myriangium duriaei CBS 260.36]|uniref:beta-glucosidase n=1 Tax=Myriangium duriaei CBS 260.36 TaxID=1168546 RepID=A0A9P4J0A8_9PEZI|nr:glycoside hydrolase family 1 protein [Myriangium duriaei CBS 260.36]
MATNGSAALKLPSDFLWGYATASYQIEGGAHQDGRGESIWDVFCRLPGKIKGGHDGEVACDSYNRYKDDVALLKSLGSRCYRFSVSWSRVIPLGGRNDPINQEGLQYYINLVDELRANGIEPMVTLFHWDLPAELDKRYGGLLNKTEVSLDFERYARVMFEALGSKVDKWVTHNEPWCSSVLGYSFGVFAPGRTSKRNKSPVGDSSTEPWIVGHSLLLAHGRAVKAFREDFKPKNGGQIGIVLNEGDWCYPWDPNDPEDVAGAQRKLEFTIGWFGDAIYKGEYPESMRKQLGDRLPHFTDEERALIKGSNDFYGMNHYCAHYVKHRSSPPEPEDHLGNTETLTQNVHGEQVGPETASDWLWPNPQGFRHLLGWISKRYGRPAIYVTENGTSLKGENDLPLEKMLEDDFRVEFYRGYVKAMAEAYTHDDVDVRGYMAWSLMDNFEWADGYDCRFGVTYVDYAGGQKRIPKKSAKELPVIFKQYIGK